LAKYKPCHFGKLICLLQQNYFLLNLVVFQNFIFNNIFDLSFVHEQYIITAAQPGLDNSIDSDT